MGSWHRLRTGTTVGPTAAAADTNRIGLAAAYQQLPAGPTDSWQLAPIARYLVPSHVLVQYQGTVTVMGLRTYGSTWYCRPSWNQYQVPGLPGT